MVTCYPNFLNSAIEKVKLELNKIENHINLILSDFELYKKLSENALKMAKNYDSKNMIDKILQVIEN